MVYVVKISVFFNSDFRLKLLREQFIPRNGVATPAQIIDGVQEGKSLDIILRWLCSFKNFRFKYGK